MGFFSDLKEDLSQAVNELMPEEALDANAAGSPEMENVLSDEQYVQDAPAADEMPDRVNALDLSSMLDKLDAADTVMEEAPAETAEAEDNVSWTDEAYAAEALETETAVEAPEAEAAVEIPEEPEAETYEEEPLPTYETEEKLAAEPEIPAEMEEMEEMEAEDIVTQPDEEEEETMDIQTNRVAVDETAVVTEGMTITGDIVSQGSMELIGTVNGNLDIYGKLNITGTIQGNSKAAEIYAEGANIVGEVNSDGSVKIGQSSVIIGNISATSAVIAGAVKGDIDVHGPVILDTTAIVMGNIKSKSVQINNGAVIEGLCSQCYADINPSTFFEEFRKKK